MRGEFYVGAVVDVIQGHIPPRIGNPFKAERVHDARRVACDVLRASGYEFGYLCRAKDGKVDVISSVRSDGTWSPILVWKGMTPADDPTMFGWREL